MKIIKPLALPLAILAALLTACGGANSNPAAKAEPNMQQAKPSKQVKVFKADQSVQCESEGIALDDARLELASAGIDVICAQKGHDGLNRIAMCGADTGSLNVFVIHPNNLVDAEKLGFQSTSELPEYQDRVCEN
ncbi:hypothetical protein [Cellvibrio fontiphilus]|uniref:Lipoprotein n=1 Tax=Cellvibrio fontiphilus TaxID=1815559 RepID=A0ABV7FGU4_9GAMM